MKLRAKKGVSMIDKLRYLTPGLLLLLGCTAGITSVSAPGPTTAPVSPPTAPQRQAAADLSSELSFDPAVRTGTLANGLTYYIRVNSKPANRAELWLAVDAGSLQEDEDQQGLAHFVEHMAFNGTQHFAKQQLIDYLERIGMRFGPDINAFTSFDETVYTLRVPTDDQQTLVQGFQILEDWAQGVTLDGEEIDKERGVVIEEWRLGRGAEARIRDQQFPVLFKDSRYAERLPIGKPEILQSAPYEALRRFYRDWYRPDLMAVIAVGDFELDTIEGYIRQHFESLPAPATPRLRELYPVPDHQETLYAITTDPEATFTTVGVYYKLERRPQSRILDYRRQLAEQLYHSMLNARLDELRQQAEPPFLFAVSDSAGFVRTRDVYLQVAAVEEGKVPEGLEALLTEVERVDLHGFTSGELQRTKAELLRRYEQAYAERDKRESEGFASEYLRHFLEGEPSPGIEVELDLVSDLLPTIEITELNSLTREWISEANQVVLVSGPKKPLVELASQEQLAAIFAEVEESDLEDYFDRVRDRPLVETPPAPGGIVSTTEIVELGITEWQLANGVRVVLKPTDFKNDQVLVAGFSPGGHSLVDDDQYASASFATALVGEGGLGEFDQIELEKALAGKLVNLQPYISELEEGIEGGASPQDLETLFQLLYLTVTEPRRDEEAFQSVMTRLRSFIENRQARPEVVFNDEIMLVRYAGHPRRLPLTLEVLDRINLDTAFEVYRHRFADAGDFIFLIVGNFEAEAIRSLVETYLGGLPSAGRKEIWRDVGADPLEGGLEIEVRKGIEPKSQVRLIWEGPAEWSREGLHDIASLAAAMRIRMREILREDLGGTYGVSVGGNLEPWPKGRFRLSLGFGCAPENVDNLVAAVSEEIESIRRQGLAESYAEKVREAQRRKRETDLKENEFWLAALKTYYELQLDPRLILAHEELVSRVTTANLQATAERYLDSEKFFRAVLYPGEVSELPK